MRVLLVEDDDLVADAVATGMRGAGLAVDCVGSAEQADTAMRTEHFDLIVLDIGLPGISGLEFLRRLRREFDGRIGRTPVLVLTARDGLDDRVNGLDLGADDYMVKPFEFRELLARSHALIRRTGSAVTQLTRIGDLSLDTSRRELRCGARLIELTPREWSIMEYLALHLDTVVPKNKLLQAISGWDDSLAPNAIEVYVSRLRAKIEGTGVTIRTVRGVGYRLEGPAA